METVEVKISRIIDSGFGVSAHDGQMVYAVIAEEIAKGNRISLSFESVTRLTTAFLNAAVGQLYGEYSDDKIRKHLGAPTHTEQWQLSRLKIVVDRAKVFFKYPDAIKQAFSEVTEPDDA